MRKFAVLLLFLPMIIQSCKDKPAFTSAELALINSAETAEPMRVLKITNTDDSLFLRKPCCDIEINPADTNLHKLINRMHVSMLTEGGVGIAANQVGISRNVFLFIRVDKPDRPCVVCINPRIVSYGEQKVSFEGDGCLSIPNRRENTLRSSSIQVEYYNMKGELVKEEISGSARPNDFSAVIFQHEFDHLQGTLYIDRIYNQQ